MASDNEVVVKAVMDLLEGRLRNEVNREVENAVQRLRESIPAIVERLAIKISQSYRAELYGTELSITFNLSDKKAESIKITEG